MNRKLNNLIDLSFSLMDKPVGKNKHFSYLLQRSNILSIGFNNCTQTHPLIKKYSKHEEIIYVHSELDAIRRFPRSPSILSKCTLVNVRLNKKGEILLSRPCKICRHIVQSFGIRKVIWTNNKGEFENGDN